MAYRTYHSRNGRSTAPRWISARYPSLCPETGKTVEKGERCLYYPAARAVYHESSKNADEQRAREFAACNMMPDRDW